MSERLRLGPRAQAVIVLLLVAAVGALAGIAGDRLVAQQRTASGHGLNADMEARGGAVSARGRGGQAPMRMPRGSVTGRNVRYAAGLAAAIDLTQEQQVAIDSIIAEERRRVRELTQELEPRFREIAQQTRQRVEGVLTAEQIEQLRVVRQQRLRLLREQVPGQRPPGMRQPPAVPVPDSLR